MWLTSVKDNNRLTSFCAIAPRIPTSIVASATHINNPSREPSVKMTERARMIAYTPTLVNRPANTAVTSDGAVG